MHPSVEPSTTRTLRVTVPPRLGVRSLARAHLLLARRPAARKAAEEGVRRVAAALQDAVHAPVTVQARLRPASARPEEGLGLGCAYARFELLAGAGAALLEVELAVVAAALDCLAGARARPAPVSRLTALEDASLVYLLLAALRALAEAGAPGPVVELAPRLTGLTLRRAEALEGVARREAHLAVDVQLGVGGVHGGGRVWLPARAAEAALHALPPERGATPLTPGLAAARLGVGARCGRARLGAAEARGLAPGDVVVLGGLRRAEDALLGPGRLLGRGFTLEGAFGAEGFRLEAAHAGRDSHEEGDVTRDGMELTVEVEVELARVALPLGELAMLREGGVLGLRVRAADPVLLRVGDRAVARAELVDIEGEVGARILALLP